MVNKEKENDIKASGPAQFTSMERRTLSQSIKPAAIDSKINA